MRAFERRKIHRNPIRSDECIVLKIGDGANGPMQLAEFIIMNAVSYCCEHVLEWYVFMLKMTFTWGFFDQFSRSFLSAMDNNAFETTVMDSSDEGGDST